MLTGQICFLEQKVKHLKAAHFKVLLICLDFFLVSKGYSIHGTGKNIHYMHMQ